MIPRVLRKSHLFASLSCRWYNRGFPTAHDTMSHFVLAVSTSVESYFHHLSLLRAYNKVHACSRFFSFFFFFFFFFFSWREIPLHPIFFRFWRVWRFEARCCEKRTTPPGFFLENNYLALGLSSQLRDDGRVFRSCEISSAMNTREFKPEFSSSFVCYIWSGERNSTMSPSFALYSLDHVICCRYNRI